MPTQIKPRFRSSTEGVNYEAVKFSIQRSAGEEKGRYRTVESLKSEQEESSEQLHRHRVRVRRRQASVRDNLPFKITKRGVLYAVATIAIAVFVKFMISQAGGGGLLNDPEIGKREIPGN